MYSKEYLATRDDNSPRLFRISPANFLWIWKNAYHATGVRITPQVLREWFCDEMGRLRVSDRCVDAFCGARPQVGPGEDAQRLLAREAERNI